MTVPVVLDAAGLDAMGADEPPQHLRALLAEAHRRGRDVLVPAVVCAETARGVGGVVVTSDAQDLQRLSAAVPQVRVVTRRPTG